MAKTKISEYDATAANNTDIDSINIAEGMAPSNVNNAIRQLMAHLKTEFFKTGTGNTSLGDGALDSLDGSSPGGSNVAIGKDALTANTTASNNTAVGHRALTENTTGAGNTSVGKDAGYYTTTGADNTYIGAAAGPNVAASTGSNNTALGRSSLRANTTGVHNTALGGIGQDSRSVLHSNTTGGYNVAVGNQALSSNTTASYNTAIGYQALNLNVTGANNTSVGLNSLYNNTTGANNTAIGLSALAANTTAATNVAVGANTLQANTTGGPNTAVGKGAMASNTTGSSNAALGFEALVSNTTGNFNTALGHQAAYSNTTAVEVIAVGTQALYNNTTGDENVAIGRAAGFENTTGIRNTYLGDDANQLNQTGSNNTVIGRFSGNQGGLNIVNSDNFIVLSDGDGNPRAIINSTGKFGVGVNPLYHLHVYGEAVGDFVSEIRNTTTNAPYGQVIRFSAAAPDNNQQHFAYYTDNAALRFVVDSNGDVRNHDNSYGALSDQRIKEDISDATSQWDDIKALKVRKFKLKDDVRQYGDNAKFKIGLVSQETELVSPNLIEEVAADASNILSSSEFGTLYEDGDDIPDGKEVGDVKERKTTVKGIRYSILYMKAVKALQEAMARIETLETKVAALEAE